MKIKIVAIFGILFFFFGCSEKNTNEIENNLKLEDLVGNYSATQLKTVINGDSINLVSIGVTLELILKNDLTTTGTLFLPDTLELTGNSGADLSYDLTGTFEIRNDNIKFNQNADTFIRDATWFWNNSQLFTKDFINTILIKH